MAGGVRVQEVRCRGCANCIKTCPTEAMRVFTGCVHIISDLCIDCGECIRKCREKAIILNEDEWELLRSQKKLVLIADPCFYVQIGSYESPSLVKEALESDGMEDVLEYEAMAFDVAAYAIARSIESEKVERLPLISTYCPAVIRLIQINFPELTGRLVPVESPLESSVALWRDATERKDDITLIAPCPAKMTLVRNPVGRELSTIAYTVSVRRVVHDILAGSPKVSGEVLHKTNDRWLKWSITGGESRHVASFSHRPLRTVAVSGLRNTMDLLTELELGRLGGVDYVECRACDLGCIGGVGTHESRFLSRLRIDDMKMDWSISEEEMARIISWYEKGIWQLEQTIEPKQRLPLSSDLSEAMAKLKDMNAIYAELPHIDCGSCGRPSCRAMAEDIVRGKGEMTDCIFKLRERILDLSKEISNLSGRVPHAFGS